MLTLFASGSDPAAWAALGVSCLSFAVAGYAAWDSYKARKWQEKVDREATAADVGFKVLAIRTADSTAEEYSIGGRSAGEQFLRSHRTYEAWVDISKVPESTDGYIVMAQLARGEPFTSARVTLDPKVFEQVRDKNAAKGLG